jgi:tetratricopeptide (TPR) repeat protein
MRIPSQPASALFALVLASACATSASAAGEPPREAAAQVTQSGGFAAYLEAQHAVAVSDTALAAERSMAALAAAPWSATLRRRAFVAAAVAGRPEAVRLARDLPDMPAARMRLANVDAVAGHWAQASERLHNLSRDGAGALLQPLLLAWAESATGHTDDAIATLRGAPQGSHFGGAYLLHAAMIADLAKRPAEADQLYQAAARGEGNVTLRLAQALASWDFRRGRPAAALRRLTERLAAGDPLHVALPDLVHQGGQMMVRTSRDGFAEAYLTAAVAMHQQEDDSSATLLLAYALDLRPDLTAARLLMSDIQELQHHPALALRTLAPVSAGDSLANVVRLRRDTFEAEAGHADMAEADLRAMAAQLPDRIEPPAALGDELRVAGRFTDAAAAYGQAISRLQGDAAPAWQLYFDRGMSYEQAHEWAKAEPDLLHAVKLAPDQPEVLNFLGYAWADQGTHLPQARRMLEQAAQERPDDSAIVDSLGWVKLRQGDVAGAVAALEHAVELGTEDPVMNAHLGDAYWAAGRHLEAEYQWRRALNLHPEPEEQARLEKRLDDAQASATHNASAQVAGRGSQQN